MTRSFRTLVFLLLSLAACLGASQTIRAWGDNTYGQTTVPAGLSGVEQIASAPTVRL